MLDCDKLLELARFDLQGAGTISVPSELIFPASVLANISKLIKDIPEEVVGSNSGSLDEQHYAFVRRVLKDDPGFVTSLQPYPAAAEIMRNLESDCVRRNLRQILPGYDQAVIRRVQYNKLVAGGFIARHKDIFANPTYTFVVSILLSDDFEGGDFIVLDEKGGGAVFDMRGGRTVITSCSREHMVTNVVSGVRESFVFFFGVGAGVNQSIYNRREIPNPT